MLFRSRRACGPPTGQPAALPTPIPPRPPAPSAATRPAGWPVPPATAPAPPAAGSAPRSRYAGRPPPDARPAAPPSPTPGSPPHSSGRAASRSVNPFLRWKYSPSSPTGRIISRLMPCAASCGHPAHTSTSSKIPPPPSPIAPNAPLKTDAKAIQIQLTAPSPFPQQPRCRNLRHPAAAQNRPGITPALL